MRLILTLILALPLAAQLPVELMRRPTLNRSGLAAGINLTGGVDTQSITSIGPSAVIMTRGANSGASTDDPTISAAGWTLDGSDRVSFTGLAAKGAAWTTTNCSGVECYTLTSAGTEYVNGVARTNKARWSEDISRSPWGAVSGSGTATVDSFTGSAADSSIVQTITGLSAGVAYTYSVELQTASPKSIRMQTYDGTNSSAPTCSVTSTYSRCAVTHTMAAGKTSLNVYVGGYNTIGIGDVVNIRNAQVETGSAFTTYQKTTDSREWALETVGNYVGLLTWWGRKDRVIGPGEALNDYRSWIRPRVNAAGNTLP